MSESLPSGEGICILSFDAGGPGSLSQLQLVEEFITRLAYDKGVDAGTLYLADLFHVIGGVGFGGYVALLLGALRLSVSEVIEELILLGTTLFPDDQEAIQAPHENSKRLKEVVEALLRRLQLPVDIKLKDTRLPGSKCRTIVLATPTIDAASCRLLRSYPCREGSLDCSFVEAACATLAIPILFEAVSIGPRFRQQKFTSASFGFGNPTNELLREAEKCFGPDKRVSVILSIGSGRPAPLSVDESTSVPDNRDNLIRRILIDCERVAHNLSTQFFDIGAYLRLNVDHGLEDIKINDWYQLGVIEGLTGVYLQSAAVTNRIDSSLRSLQDRIGSVTLGQLSRSTSIKIMAKTAPAVSPYFVMRKDYWDIMERHLIIEPQPKQKIMVLSGMGGSGKTQMASYFVHEHHARFDHVFFIDACSEASIRGDLQLAVRSLGAGHEQETAEDALVFMATGPHNGNWVLIFDNSDDHKLSLVPFIPKCYNGMVLITTRNPNLGMLNTTAHIELGPMGNEEALETLLRSAHRTNSLDAQERGFAQQLITELGGLAVALVQAGSYCYQMSSRTPNDEQDFTFEQYLSLLKSSRAMLLAVGPPASLDDYRRGVYATLDLSYSALLQSTRQLLHLVGFFHYSDISLSTFISAAQRDFTDPEHFLDRPEKHDSVLQQLRDIFVPGGQFNELHIHEIVRNLRSFSLVTTSTVSGTIYLRFHPLVHSWVYDTLSPPDIRRYKELATLLLTSSTGDDKLAVRRSLRPHILRRLSKEGHEDMHVNDLMAFGRGLREVGQYAPSEVVFKSAVAELKRVNGIKNPATLTASAELGVIYWDQGRHSEAKVIEVEVLEVTRDLFGPEHANTIKASAYLACTLHNQQLWAEAEKLAKEALDIGTRMLGREHLCTIMGAAELASTYREQELWEEAEKYGSEVLRLRKKVLGPEHQETLKAAANLAYTFRGLNRWEEAEELEVGVLDTRRRRLGREHPETIHAAVKLADMYRSQRRWNEARDLDIELVEVSRKVFGPEHPNTLKALADLAETEAAMTP